MGLVRVKVKELAEERGWTLKEVSERSGVIYYWQSRKPRNFSSWMKASSAFKRLSFNGYCDGGH